MKICARVDNLLLFFCQRSETLASSTVNLRVSGGRVIEKRTVSGSCAGRAISMARAHSATERLPQRRRF